MANYNQLEERATLIRTVAEEGIVLLKNEENFFPLAQEKIAVFGRTQVDTIKCGTGSAYCESEYMIDILTGLEHAGINVDEELAAEYRTWSKANSIASFGVWGSGAHVNPEMPMPREKVREASLRAEKAIVVIGRTAGENDDVAVQEGDYLLSAEEKELIESVCRYFSKVAIVANVGNLINYFFTTRDEIKGLVLLHLPGMEGGNALGRVLSGKVSPSGKMTDTVASSYKDYPASAYFGKKAGIEQNYYEDIFVGYRYFETFEHAKSRVLYPFGHGLSYTEFEVACAHFESDKTVKGKIRALVSVKNIGKTYAGKEVVMLYTSSPNGVLGTPTYELRAFAKTKLLSPGEQELIPLTFDIAEMASFDDTGVLGTPDAWVMEKGTYTVSLGNNVEKLTAVGTFENPETTVIKTCVHMQTELDRRLKANGEYEALETMPRDPENGVFIDPLKKIVMDGDSVYAKGENSVTYRMEITAAGIYTVRFEADAVCDVMMDGKPLVCAEAYFEKGYDTVLNLGVHEIVFTGKNDVTVEIAKNDSPAVIAAEGESYVEGGKYAECGLWVTNHPFTDENGAIRHGRALTRMHSEGRYALYKLDVKKPGIYDVRLRYSSTRAARDLRDTFSFLVSNVTQEIESVTLNHTTDEAGKFVFETSEPISIALPKGEAFLKIVSKTNEPPITAYMIFSPSTREALGAAKTEAAAAETAEETMGSVMERRSLSAEIGEYDFRRVLEGSLSMDAFVDSLTNEELALLSCGNPNGHIGYMPEKGIPEAYWSDGPVGLRQPFRVSVYPSSTMVASTWNTELAKEYARSIATEANLYNVDVWLAPGMNIHRDPCCGRNFEYYSEDPYLSGKIAAAMTAGAQEFDVATTIKHFAANNTEYLRMKSNSRLSARAFREIYAKGFEISIRECEPFALMTSYNHINGVKVCEDPMLCEDVLRDEFGFTGLLITDYGNDSVHIKELAAGHDLKMSFGDPKGVEAALENGTLPREKVQLSVKRILEMIAKTAGKRLPEA